MRFYNDFDTVDDFDNDLSPYCAVDGMLLNDNGECERCQASAAAEQAEEDCEDLAFED